MTHLDTFMNVHEGVGCAFISPAPQTMLQQFLHDFGYFALFLGTFFEGETILVLAGFLAFRGYMDINLVVVVAFLAAMPATSCGISWGANTGASCWRANRVGN